MRNNRYIDFDLMKKYPNKYDLTPADIKNLVILDWNRLQLETWLNHAKKATGTWWCHLEGCQSNGNYNDESEFWIGFRKEDNKIDYSFTCMGGMCKYVFDKFYSMTEIENKFDMQVQANTIRWLNKMIDEGILKKKD